MKKILFIDRDGTIVAEPDNEQLDSFNKLRFLPGVISALRSISLELNYELVMVTNQDGLGTDDFPESNFQSVQDLIMQILEGEGIIFRSVHIDRSFPAEKLDTRKPGTGMLKEYLEGNFDIENSFVIGDRFTDVELAVNLGSCSILIRENERNLGSGETNSSEEELASSLSLRASSWDEIYKFLRTRDRKVILDRNTSETRIKVELNPDGNGTYDINTGLGFFDHMLEQLSRHGGMDLAVHVDGDLHIDEHHTIEDTAITLGEAFKQAIGNKVGIERYGYHLPMDDARATCLVDLGGRSWIEWKAGFKREKIGEMPTEMFFHFFKSFSDSAKCNLFIEAEGTNEHHKIEAIFKAFARALKSAVRREEGNIGLPTTKGIL